MMSQDRQAQTPILETYRTGRLYQLYGWFMIAMGVISILTLGASAKTALISGGSMGVVALVIGFFMKKNHTWSFVAGITHSLSLIIIFAWRVGASFGDLKAIARKEIDGDVVTKAIAMMIIGLLFVISLIVTSLQISSAKKNGEVIKSLKSSPD